jgi:hypothetical protein
MDKGLDIIGLKEESTQPLLSEVDPLHRNNHFSLEITKDLTGSIGHVPTYKEVLSVTPLMESNKL